jgi:hypothetical protein
MSKPEPERLEQNVRRTVGAHVLKEIRGLVDEELRAEEARKKWLAGMLRYGLAILLLAALLLAYFLGVI